jgi:integrase
MTESAVRQRRQVLTDAMIAKLPRHRAVYFHPDPELPKHGIRVRPTGPGAYTVITRDPYKKQRWVKIGSTAEMKIEEAREIARSVIKRVEAGDTPFPPAPVKPDSVEAVARNWLKRHVDKNKLRTADEIKRLIEKYVLPHWAERNFVSIKRRDVAALLDHIEDQHGAATADAVLTVLRSVAGWYVGQGHADDDYVSPFREIKRRVPKDKRKRKRILDDAELRRVWTAAGDAGAYGAFIRLALLSGQRYAKVVDMKWDDLDPDTGVWTIATEEGEKGNAGELKLPEVAIAIIKSQPRFANPYVFVNNRGFNSQFKRLFDERCGVTGWRIHDLRRTARSLMSKAGVLSEHSERVLGHSLGPIDDTYNKYTYDAEKGYALERLAALISIIVAGKPTDDIAKLRAQIDEMVAAPSNVVRLRSPAAAS